MPDISVAIAGLHWFTLAWFEVAYVALPGCLLYWLLAGETRLLRLVGEVARILGEVLQSRLVRRSRAPQGAAPAGAILA